MIPLKNDEDLVLLRKSGSIAAGILNRLREYLRPGIETRQLDNLAAELAKQENASCAFLGYKGFAGNVCVSINEEIVHGIPGDRVINDGDIVSIDLGINYQGYFSDAAITVGVGRIEARNKKLIQVTRAALAEGISKAKPQNHVSDISAAIQNYVEKNGFSVVRQFVGHGIGRALHEEPEIPNFGPAHQGPVLKSGMVLAIEPMVNMGTWECQVTANGWTAVTKDGLASAHFEHTVAITQTGAQILTCPSP